MNITTGSLRFEVLQRDGFKCRYCGIKPLHVTLHVDHVMPRALGGTNDRWNLTAACQACNLGKHAASPSPELVAAVISDDVRYSAQQQRAGSELCSVCSFPVITDENTAAPATHVRCANAVEKESTTAYMHGADDWTSATEERAKYTDPLARHIDRFAGIERYEHWSLACHRWESTPAERMEVT